MMMTVTSKQKDGLGDLPKTLPRNMPLIQACGMTKSKQNTDFIIRVRTDVSSWGAGGNVSVFTNPQFVQKCRLEFKNPESHYCFAVIIDLGNLQDATNSFHS